jgi:hypothetical protein
VERGHILLPQQLRTLPVPGGLLLQLVVDRRLPGGRLKVRSSDRRTFSRGHSWQPASYGQ